MGSLSNPMDHSCEKAKQKNKQGLPHLGICEVIWNHQPELKFEFTNKPLLLIYLQVEMAKIYRKRDSNNSLIRFELMDQ